jgi:ribonuclease-3
LTEAREALLVALEERIGHTFRERALLDRALTHRSWAYEQSPDGVQNYERLEFLGDALLGFLVSEWLCSDDPEALEGVLTRRKQSVVRTESLAEAARRLELGAAMRLGRGEDSTGGREKESLLADVFEALLGAVFVDGGVRAARAFVRRQLGGSLRARRGLRQVADDFKTILQERVQAELRVTPRYRIVRTQGPAHAHEFEVEVVVGAQVLGTGSGTSRKQAEQQAARAALALLPGTAGEAAR